MHNRKKICVLMTTYNPPSYFKDQVKSILDQQDVEVELYVRDDASTMTQNLRVLDGFKNVHLIHAEKNTGTSDNIKALLNYARTKLPEFKYYAYSDQDDVCKLNKYIVASERVDALNENKPALYCGNLLVCDKDLNPSHELFPRNVVNLSLGQSLAQVFCFACTTMFNKAMLDVMCEHDFKTIGFDSLLYYIGVLNHNIYYDDEPYIYYRQHGNNVSGVKRKGLDYILHKVKEIGLSNKSDTQVMRKNAIYLLGNFDDKLGQDEKEMLNKIANYSSLKDRILLIRDRKIRAGYQPKDFYLHIRQFVGKY